MKKSNVTLRRQVISSGKVSLYLDFYPPIWNTKTNQYSRREFLKLYLFDKPKNQIEKIANVENLHTAELIQIRRQNELRKEPLLAKNNLEQQLDQKRKHILYFIASVSLLFLIVLFLGYVQYKTKKQYQKHFTALQIKKASPTKKADPTSPNPIADMSPSLAASLEQQLEKWEQDKKFLATEISLGKLAMSFQTNSKYLSLLILHCRHKNFTTYINDLKIDYLIALLDQDPRLRHYTHQALADEIGFSSVQRFTSAFLSRTKVPLSYYIKKIQKINNHSS